jgi:hypothetical protein
MAADGHSEGGPRAARPGFSEHGKLDLDLQAGDECGFTVTGSDGGVGRVEGELWLKVKDVTKPIVKPTITGTLGKNGFYTSDAKVAWTVTDTDRVTKKSSGCDGSTVTTDTAGQTFTCSAVPPAGRTTESVTVKRDTTAPALTVPGTVVAEGATADGRIVDYAAGVVDNLDPRPALNCSAASGSRFPIGATQVTCDAVDAAGNKVSRAFEVIVLRAPEPVPAPAPATEPVTQVHVSGPVTIAHAPMQINPLLSFRFTIAKRMTRLATVTAAKTLTVRKNGAPRVS